MTPDDVKLAVCIHGSVHPYQLVSIVKVWWLLHEMVGIISIKFACKWAMILPANIMSDNQWKLPYLAL